MRDISRKLDTTRQADLMAASRPIEPMLAEIIDRLERLPRPDSPMDLRPIERLLHSLDAKLELGAARSVGADFVGRIADDVSRRLEKDLASRLVGHDLAEQIAELRERLDALSGLADMQGLMRRITVQLAGLSGAATESDHDRAPSTAVRPDSAGSLAIRRIEALGLLDEAAPGAARRESPATAPAEDGASGLPPEEELLEPGAGAPPGFRELREPVGENGPRTSPSISLHIAAARRAAHAALSETGAGPSSDSAPSVSRGMERAKSLYVDHKRTALLAAGFAVVALAAVRLVSMHPPLTQRSGLDAEPGKAVTMEASPDSAARPIPLAEGKVDSAPTASIPPPQARKGDSAKQAPELSESLSAALPTALRDAVAAGSSSGQYELAQRLIDGRGVPQDQPAAALWLERAASSGFAPAQFKLAALYSNGVGVPRDAAAAKRWYQKAAEAGNARAAHNLAVMFAEPAAGTPDYVEAVRWFRKAAELGVRDSQFNLAVLYARGAGIPQDLRQSWLWFSLAAAQGDSDAVKKRDEVAARMTPEALAAAADDLAKFKTARPDPIANEAPAPAGGWDGKAGTSSLGETPAPAASANFTP
jgi:localization factor PodJL